MRGRFGRRLSDRLERGERDHDCQAGCKSGILFNLVEARLKRATGILATVLGRRQSLISATAVLKEAESRHGFQRAMHRDWHPQGQQRQRNGSLQPVHGGEGSCRQAGFKALFPGRYLGPPPARPYHDCERLRNLQTWPLVSAADGDWTGFIDATTSRDETEFVADALVSVDGGKLRDGFTGNAVPERWFCWFGAHRVLLLFQFCGCLDPFFNCPSSISQVRSNTSNDRWS